MKKIDGFAKSPSAALRFNFVVAEGGGGSPSRPKSGNPAGCPYHRICAPCIWSFLQSHRSVDFYETLNIFQVIIAFFIVPIRPGMFNTIFPSLHGLAKRNRARLSQIPSGLYIQRICRIIENSTAPAVTAEAKAHFHRLGMAKES
jgi:hypothetical protein